jgi:hypothetical protein
VKELSAGVVSADKDGKLVTSKDVAFDEVSAISVAASKSVKTAALIISSAKSAALLTTDSEGTVSAADKLQISSISTGSVSVSGLSASGSLRVEDLTSTAPSVLTADNKGNVMASSNIKVTSVGATDVTVSGSLSVASLSLPGASAGGVLAVVNSKGVVEASSSVKMTDITTEKLIVSELAVVSDLQIKSLTTKSLTPELVVVDNTGKLTSLPDLNAYLPDMKDSKFSSVEVSGRVTANTFQVSSANADLADGMVMSVDNRGVMKPSASPTLTGLTVTSDLKVLGSMQTEKMVLANTASSLLFSNSRNEVEALSGSQILKDGTLSLASAKIDSFIGDIAMNGNAVIGAKISKGLIKESEFFLDSNAAKHEGNLVVRNLESGLLEYSASVGINSAGLLKTNGFVPMHADANIAITKATMTDSTLNNVVIQDATSVQTKSLSVKGAADFSEDIFVEGSITVRGTVMGSGPYVDSSDARFKKNVSPITGALDKVCAIGGDYYEYRVDEFPSRGFETGRQMGWIAQNVQAVAPELVREDEEGFKSVAYARSAALLAAAVRELREEYELELQAVMKELRATQLEVSELRKQLQSSA